MDLEFMRAWQVLYFITFMILAVVIPLVALIEILRSRFNNNEKIIWILLVLFLNFFGSILYFVIGRKQRISE